ncbi:3-phosphoshikimate 1-carboxyvinyltransferase [Chitinivibrio alkaliphilus]|uniref:3-phosphoshikimate 1-carboxyvinyltransferase n=1 Tax=Chitinivibrio alkaliphilus ACht1 TaxID=1313304 RepID=U7DCA9_9BACT|nr:3-phosphoshikimate 1-carboxyvinyltransferase [Chitinivibrio alkaliphilus]ERP39213.1 3-phosphoshikimate 1-carboxyvinyltransferase [Chitinivibrio alkaliphilus ACht1]
MKWLVTKSRLQGAVDIPASKSHTIRALLIATLARGESVILKPLFSKDGVSALHASKCLGAEISEQGETLIVQGTGGAITPKVPMIDMGNSGTSTRLFTLAAALSTTPVCFDGDASLRSRPMGPLLQALQDLGGSYECTEKDGHLPYSVHGSLRGTDITVDGTTSQYLSALLMTTPLIPGNTVISVPQLNEKPYVEMTLWWLDKMEISYEVNSGFNKFLVYGDQQYRPIEEKISGDFSSATFAAVGAAVTGGSVTLHNLDFSDPQGDKGVFDILRRMGATVTIEGKSVTVSAQQLHGTTIDLNAMPDAIAALAVLGTVAEGETRIENVAQARIKETDRIAVMADELRKMGADIEELDDGLIIRKSTLHGAAVSGHEDHRVVMALALAGMIASGETEIDTAEAADVTYPSFYDDFTVLGGHLQKI